MNINAWLLHKSSSRNRSTRLRFFTRELGLIVCWYPGGSSLKKQGILQCFMPLWLHLYRKRDWYNVQAVETVTVPLPLTGTALFSALYLNELLVYALKPCDPYPELFDLYEQTLQGLALVKERLAIESLLRRFEWTLVASCGYALFFTEDKQATYYQWEPERGFVAAVQGFSSQEILAISQGDFTQVSVLKAAKKIMRQVIDHVLGGRPLLSRSLFMA